MYTLRDFDIKSLCYYSKIQNKSLNSSVNNTNAYYIKNKHKHTKWKDIHTISPLIKNIFN